MGLCVTARALAGGSSGCLVVLWVADRLICTVGAVYGATELDSVGAVPSYRRD